MEGKQNRLVIFEAAGQPVEVRSMPDAIPCGCRSGRWRRCSRPRPTTSACTLKNIYAESELGEEATIEDSLVVRQEGARRPTQGHTTT